MKNVFFSVAMIAIIALGLMSCDKANDPEFLIPAGDVQEVSIDKKIYDFQIFYDLSTNSVVDSNAVSAWDISVQTWGSDTAVFMNTGMAYFGYKTTSTNISDDITLPATINWVYDDQSGDAAKTAIGNWKNGEVYLIGMKNLTNPDPSKQTVTAKYKVSFEKTSSGVTVKWADITKSTVTVESASLKTSDSSRPFTWVNFTQGGKAAKQPPVKDAWDVVLTPYIANVGIPYMVNGVLINRQGDVKAYKHIAESEHTSEWYTALFGSLNTDSVKTTSYLSDAHAIGYNWKVSAVDSQGNPTGVYTIKTSNMYIIKDADNHQYKYRITNFYNNGEKGYVTFEYALLATPVR